MPDSPAAVGAPLTATDRSLPARLRLKPGVPTTAYVDGGWWPHSTSLQAELPALLTRLARSIGPIASVGYHLNAWEHAPDHLDLGDDRVLLQGFTGDDPRSVVVVATTGQRLTLAVVAPQSTDQAARQALASASEPVADVEVDLDAGKATDRSLTEVAIRLGKLEGFTDVAHRATITRWVREAAQQFTRAPIQSYVPILVEHIVRGQLAAYARATEPPSADQAS